MFANLAFRDKIIIFVLSIALVVCVFIFAIFKPLTADIKEKKVEQQKVSDLEREVRDKVENQLPVLQETYAKTKKGADVNSARFTVTPKDTIKLDEMLKAILDENKLLAAFSMTDPVTEELEYYYDEVVDPYMLTTYPIKESADIDGSVAKAMEEANRYSRAIEELPPQTVLVTTVGIGYRADKASIMAFIDAIGKLGANNSKSGANKLDGTIRILDLSFSDYTFGAESDDPYEQHTTEGDITIAIYSVEPPHYDE